MALFHFQFDSWWHTAYSWHSSVPTDSSGLVSSDAVSPTVCVCEVVLLEAGDAVFETLRCSAAGAGWVLVVVLRRVGAGLWGAGIVVVLRRSYDIVRLTLQAHVKRLGDDTDEEGDSFIMPIVIPPPSSSSLSSMPSDTVTTLSHSECQPRNWCYADAGSQQCWINCD